MEPLKDRDIIILMEPVSTRIFFGKFFEFCLNNRDHNWIFAFA
jgi:hypothetical protein